MQGGFVDVQVNGWMGVSFSDPALTVEQVLTITRQLLAEGTLAYCPTVCTGPLDMYTHNLPVIAEAMADPRLGKHILGVHLEGPYISIAPGAVGAHNPAWVRKPTVDEFDRMQAWAHGQARLITLAPEFPGALELIRHCRAQGVSVSIGHHWADEKTLQQAVAAGAQSCTHVGNGIPNLIHRHQNPLWWQLATDEIYGMFITDGHHLPLSLIKVALRSKTVARTIISSDASALGGLPAGHYHNRWGDVEIEPSGRIYMPATQSLCGSHACLRECMDVLAGMGLLTEDELWQVGYVNPLALLGLPATALDLLPSTGIQYRQNAGKPLGYGRWIQTKR